MHCTLFEVSANELVASGDSLPGYDDPSMSRSTFELRRSTLELGSNWPVLHVALGNHGADHPLGFLEGGGEPRPEFGGNSSGRYFTPGQVVKILAALASLRSPGDSIERLRIFMAGAVTADLGLVVYHFAPG